MEPSLVDALVKSSVQYAQGGDPKTAYTPFIATDRDRFLPSYAPQQSNVEGFLQDQLHGAARVGGSTNAFTGKVWTPTELSGSDPIEQASTYIHENYHSRRADVPFEYKLAIHDHNQQLFGGPDKYNDFLDDMSKELGMNHWLYSVQHALPFVGRINQEDEILAHLVGNASVKSSKDVFKEAINRVHPQGYNWFDYNTRAMDLFRDKTK